LISSFILPGPKSSNATGKFVGFVFPFEISNGKRTVLPFLFRGELSWHALFVADAVN
jgi:hypothetical protein